LTYNVCVNPMVKVNAFFARHEIPCTFLQFYILIRIITWFYFGKDMTAHFSLLEQFITLFSLSLSFINAIVRAYLCGSWYCQIWTLSEGWDTSDIRLQVIYWYLRQILSTSSTQKETESQFLLNQRDHHDKAKPHKWKYV